MCPLIQTTLVSELHGIMNAEMRGARQCPNSKNDLPCPVREPSRHRGRRTGVLLRDGTKSRISLNCLLQNPVPLPLSRRFRIVGGLPLNKIGNVNSPW